MGQLIGLNEFSTVTVAVEFPSYMLIGWTRKSMFQYKYLQLKIGKNQTML